MIINLTAIAALLTILLPNLVFGQTTYTVRSEAFADITETTRARISLLPESNTRVPSTLYAISTSPGTPNPAAMLTELWFGLRLTVIDNNGNPVNADQLKLTSVHITRSRYNPSTNVVTPNPNGLSIALTSFNPPNDNSFPDVRGANTAGNTTSTDGDSIVGTPLISTSTFELTSHRVSLRGGSSVNPPFTGSFRIVNGAREYEYVTMRYDFSGDFTISGITNTFSGTRSSSILVVQMPQLVAKEKLPGNQVALVVNGVPLTDGYVVEHTPSLDTQPITWSNATISNVVTTSPTSQTFEAAAQGTADFYRLRWDYPMRKLLAP